MLPPRKTLEQRFWEKVSRPSDGAGCWTWVAACDRYGYGRIGDGRKIVFAHRLSWTIHRGSDPGDMFVLHRCDNPRCVNPAHLFLGTHMDNMRDMNAKKRGRLPPVVIRAGERAPTAKVNQTQVGEIREARGIIPQRTLAKRYGISCAQVCRIQTGQRWSHVAG